MLWRPDFVDQANRKIFERDKGLTVPVTVKYSITPFGRTLSKTVDALSAWAEKHFPDVQRAQQSYDRQVAR